jgi:hypothetical protein
VWLRLAGSKIHHTVDTLGNSRRWIPTEMEGADVTQIRGLIDGLGNEAVIRNKGYNAERLKQFCHKATRHKTVMATLCPYSPSCASTAGC